MADGVAALALTAVVIGVTHTLLGPDHYLPFVFMARARGWSHAKTQLITFACGLGHVASSVVLGFLGIALGLAVASLESVEAVRGEVAAWALIAFGLVYFAWGLRRALRGQPHCHLHLHENGSAHEHVHVSEAEHLHVHDGVPGELSVAAGAGQGTGRGSRSLTPWVLFTIFILGPCEPLIPLLMYPAAQSSLMGVAVIAVLYGAATLATMAAAVWAASAGFERLPLGSLERYVHAVAGGAILSCGLAIQFLGL
jgi:sulfite exporter TauE/SafE